MQVVVASCAGLVEAPHGRRVGGCLDQLGRLTGLVVLVPLALFAWQRRIGKKLALRLLVLVGIATFAILRLRSNPEVKGRSSRFFEPIVSFPFVPGHEVVGTGDDCDDTDAAINTSAEETLGDSTDADCDGGDDTAPSRCPAACSASPWTTPAFWSFPTRRSSSRCTIIASSDAI